MNSFFLDGSALAKRYVAEPGTPLLDSLLDNVSPDRIVVLNVGFAEVVSVLIRPKNNGSVMAGGEGSSAALLSWSLLFCLRPVHGEASDVGVSWGKG